MVGKSDFNENPVVSLDLDLDFGFRLRVCQYNWKTEEEVTEAALDGIEALEFREKNKLF